MDDFAFRKGHTYGTILIDAVTRQRVDVLPDRKADTLEVWLRGHPGVEIVCRDSSSSYAQAVRRVLPEAIQVTDRWHMWANLGEAVLKEVACHSTCWAASVPRRDSRQATTTMERWGQVHGLLDKGVGLLECARRLQLALNTVNGYVRASKPERMIRAPQYRSTLVDPYRDYLRRRRIEEPAVSHQRLFDEIKARGYPGSLNLLSRYITQGRVENDRRSISPRRLTELILTNPTSLDAETRDLLDKLTSACPEMTVLSRHVRDFAALPRPEPDNAELLDKWIAAVQSDGLPYLHAFTRGLGNDHDAVTAAITLPFHNGGTEGVNTKTKLIKRQMYGRAGFALLRYRILLG